jgi:hypothetical protein
MGRPCAIVCVCVVLGGGNDVQPFMAAFYAPYTSSTLVVSFAGRHPHDSLSA